MLNKDNINLTGNGKEALLFYIPGHCAGCKRAISILETKELKDWEIYLVDSEDENNRPLIEKYNVSTAPTIVTFNNGEVDQAIVGLRDFLQKKEIFE